MRNLLALVTLSALLFASTAGAQTIGQTSGPVSVTLAWDPSPDPDVVNYNIYYGTNSRAYQVLVHVGNLTNATVSGLARGVTYYFTATALDSAGLESDYSNEVSYGVPALPPAPVLRLAIAPLNGALTLTWAGIPGSAYQLQTSSNLLTWSTLGTVTADTSGAVSFIDLVPLSATFYRVLAK